VIVFDLSKQAMIFPVVSSMRNFLGHLCDEVPPHENAFTKGNPSNENGAGRGMCFKLQTIAATAKIVKKTGRERVVFNPSGSADHNKRMFPPGVEHKGEGASCSPAEFGSNKGGSPGRGTCTEKLPGKDGHVPVRELDSGAVAVMIKPRRAVSFLLCERDPKLDAVKNPATPEGSEFRMRNTSTGAHQIHFPWNDTCARSEAILVQDLTVEKPRHRLEPDVWMRSDVHGFALTIGFGTIKIKETPGPAEVALTKWKGTHNTQAAAEYCLSHRNGFQERSHAV